MKQVQLPQAFLRKRKMMLVLPLLVIPFLTMAFWALGGGKGNEDMTTGKAPGLNLNLPDARLREDKLLDKLSFYDKADKDSVKLAEEMRNDPYYNNRHLEEYPATAATGMDELEQLTQTTASKYKQSLNTSPYEKAAPNPEQKIMQKLALLENEMNKIPMNQHEETLSDHNTKRDEAISGEIDRLENMMGMMNKGNENDPEMKQLDNTLNKILDIQHPERVKDRTREKSLKNREIVFAVSKEPAEESISLLDTVKKNSDTETGFYGLNDQTVSTEDNNSIQAVVHENQTLVNGAVIKLRLLDDVFINGSLIPKGSFVFGIASLHDERLQVEVNSIIEKHNLYSVKLEVYDMDGLPGIYIPGAITRDVAKQSADNSLQLMELSSMDPSLKAQAVSTGINTAKSLLSKKVKLVKVSVKAGYKVLLRDMNAQR